MLSIAFLRETVCNNDNRASRTSPRKRVMCPREGIFCEGVPGMADVKRAAAEQGQVPVLQGRGVVVDDAGLCEKEREEINPCRLTAYLPPFRPSCVPPEWGRPFEKVKCGCRSVPSGPPPGPLPALPAASGAAPCVPGSLRGRFLHSRPPPGPLPALPAASGAASCAPGRLLRRADLGFGQPCDGFQILAKPCACPLARSLACFLKEASPLPCKGGMPSMYA